MIKGGESGGPQSTKGIVQDVRPASAEITGQQRELFAFDAFEYETPELKIGGVVSEDYLVGLKSPWKFKLGEDVVELAQLGPTIVNESGKLNLELLNVDEIFAQDITATGTITGGTIVGATFQTDEDSFGNYITIKTGKITFNDSDTNLISFTETFGSIMIGSPSVHIHDAYLGRVFINDEFTVYANNQFTVNDAFSAKYPGTVAGLDSVIFMLNLPTSAPGGTGRVWRDGTTLRIT